MDLTLLSLSVKVFEFEFSSREGSWHWTVLPALEIKDGCG